MAHSKMSKNALALGALGVVFGDIGTSPLYALKECFSAEHGLALTQANIYGICSLIFWALTLVIVFKYVAFILNADNNGEGGIMALLSLVKKPNNASIPLVVVLGIFGTALLYGDGIITPAISVLSAVEGVKEIAPSLSNLVIPITLVILLSLFLVQKYGTEKIGSFFGPILVLWFGILFSTGIYWVYKNPEILKALNPIYAYHFFLNNGLIGFLVLGSVFLVVTGGEALYADLGHFGKEPIRRAWFCVVYPSLVANYFGQGSLLLEKGASAVSNPFYNLVEGWMLYPLIIVATLATIIASQALITGAFSLTQQAMRLGYLPRIVITHTSRESQGQIYISKVNTALMIGCLLLVITMRESSKLAAAYGIAVTGTMALTSLLFYIVAREKWNWSKLKAGSLVAGFLLIDFAFFGANVVKIAHGGWIPLVIGAVIFWVMISWKKGKLFVFDYIQKNSVNLDDFIDKVSEKDVYRNKGTAIFMAINKEIAPYSLVNNFKHNNTIHEQVAILTITTENVPEVPSDLKVDVQHLKSNFYKITAHYGYMETPDVEEILRLCEEKGFLAKIPETSFFLGREFIVPNGNYSMSYLSKRLFQLLTSNSQSAMDFFKLPQDRVIEIGGQVRL